MSSLSSPVAAVEKLRFNALPTKRKVAMAAAVRVGRATVFVDAKGNVYSTQVKAHCFYTLGSGLGDTLTGCRILGLLSKEAVQKHEAVCKAEREKRDRKYAAQSFAENAKALGLKLTAAQMKAIKAAA